VEQLRTQLTTAGATVDKSTSGAKRRLAYRVGKYREGAYVLFQFSAGPEMVRSSSAACGCRHSPEVPDGAHRRDTENGWKSGRRSATQRAAKRATSAPPPSAPGRARRRDPDFQCNT